MTPDRAVRLIAALEKAPQDKQDQALAFLEDATAATPRSLNAPEPFLTLRELAEKLNFHPTTLWRWQIPSHQLAGRPRFKVSEVVAYLASDAFKLRARALRRSRRSGGAA